MGYAELDGGEYVELYDIDADPEEMNDLSSTKPDLGGCADRISYKAAD